ncbi:MAG: sigma-54 dependent transcriptional regulator [Candidatus Sumerlaeia bacterium]|nr:sigma-54 dependent transcriptional regulator [Candidatus Sumerlaeia bacterium]
MESAVSTSTPSVLIIEDDEVFRQSLVEVITQLNFEISVACSMQEALDHLAQYPVDYLFLDLTLPDGDGVQLIEDKDRYSIEKLIVISNENSHRSAAEAMKMGADECLTKPVSFNQITELLKKWQVERSQPNAKARPRQQTSRMASSKVLFPDKSTNIVHQQIMRVAPSHATVLLQGESGTGKEIVARKIHEHSNRAQMPFVPVNSGAISSTLIESELFGHEAGSFTGAVQRHFGCFEQAQGGTLFFDEITEMPSELQVKLLRVLETGRFRRVGGRTEIQVNVRLIAATNRDPKKAIQMGKLREDLYYRLNVFPLRLPPLRDTPHYIHEFALLFLKEFNALYKDTKSFSSDCMEAMRQYDWPGNIRELRNSIHRGFLMHDSVIESVLESEALATLKPQEQSNGSQKVSFHVGTSLATVERVMIRTTLANFNGDKTRAAKSLGISLKTLYNRLASERKDPMKLPM